jgi:hypothetical protein
VAQTTDTLRANAYGTSVHIAKGIAVVYGHAQPWQSVASICGSIACERREMALRARDADRIAERMTTAGCCPATPDGTSK